MMTDVVNVSANMAAWASDAMKPPQRVPTSVAAREARRMEVRQERDGVSEDDIESTVPAIQSTAIALDLLNEGNRQPQSAIQRVIDAYIENE
jgi:hypothetical protein